MSYNIYTYTLVLRNLGCIETELSWIRVEGSHMILAELLGA